jgi:hypothetical protein
MVTRKLFIASVGFMLLTSVTYAAFQPSKETSFKLTDSALNAVLATKNLSANEAVSLLKQVKEFSDKVQSVRAFSLPDSFIDVIEQNIDWTLLRKIGLEQKKINLNACTQMKDFDKSLLPKLEEDYYIEMNYRHVAAY